MSVYIFTIKKTFYKSFYILKIITIRIVTEITKKFIKVRFNSFNYFFSIFTYIVICYFGRKCLNIAMISASIRNKNKSTTNWNIRHRLYWHTRKFYSMSFCHSNFMNRSIYSSSKCFISRNSRSFSISIRYSYNFTITNLRNSYLSIRIINKIHYTFITRKKNFIKPVI